MDCVRVAKREGSNDQQESVCLQYRIADHQTWGDPAQHLLQYIPLQQAAGCRQGRLHKARLRVSADQRTDQPNQDLPNGSPFRLVPVRKHSDRRVRNLH